MFYRVKQFWWNLTDKMNDDDIKFINNHLKEDEKLLFYSLSNNEQKHSVKVCYNALNKLSRYDMLDENSMIKVALLHDVGKSYKHVNIIEKSILVILNKIFPKLLKKFINIKSVKVYYEHGEMGYNLLKGKGYSEEILDAIRYHHSSNNLRNKRRNIYMEILKESDDEC